MVVAGDWAVQTRKMLHPQTIEIVPDLPILAVRAAEEFILLAEEALRKGGLFSVALAGGSTPQQMYTRLSQASLSWDRICFFWGDERCVPPDHHDSNYRMAYEALLKSIPVPQNNIFRIHGEFPVKQAAQKYEEDLHLFFDGNIPQFNLVVLGLGSDGHTASLFPGEPAIHNKSQWVAPVIHKVPPPPLVDRVTLTMPVLNAAANVLFLVSGSEKTTRLAQVLNGPFNPALIPAQAVKPVKGTSHWLIDQAAATNLPTRKI